MQSYLLTEFDQVCLIFAGVLCNYELYCRCAFVDVINFEDVIVCSCVVLGFVSRFFVVYFYYSEIAI